MYLKWAKRHLGIVLIIQLLLMMLAIIINGLKLIYFEVFLCSASLFGIVLYLLLRFIANTVSPRIMMNVIFLDVAIIILFVISLFGIDNGLPSVAIWGLVPMRTFMVFFCNRFNVRGSV
jgi:hypothetical protein